MSAKPRTLLLQPPYGEPKMEPAGLLYLATYLRQHGYEADLAYESWLTRVKPEEMIGRAIDGGYDLVGVSTLTPPLPTALVILKAVKEARPRTLTLMGGYHAKVAHANVLRKYPWVDVVVRGEGEETLLEIVRRVEAGRDLEGVEGLCFRRGGEIRSTPLRALTKDLDALPFPDRTLGPGPEEYAHTFDESSGGYRVTANVTSSRGCPYSCAFCVLGSDPPGSPISLRRWRARTPANVVDEIEELQARHGVRAVAFAEDNFSVSTRRLEAFADEVLGRGLDILFRFDARANQVVRFGHLLPKLRQAGLRKIEVGIESGSQAVLERFAKGTQVDDNVRALQLMAEHRIEPRIDFIMFAPFTRVEDLEVNARFLRQHAPPGYCHNRTTCQRLELHPGTNLQAELLESGFVEGDPDTVIDWQFEHPDVATVFELLDGFYWDHQTRLDNLMKRMHRYQVQLAERLKEDERRRVLRNLVFVTVPSNGLPLKLLEGVLEAGRRSQYEADPMREVVRHYARRVTELDAEFDAMVARYESSVGRFDYDPRPVPTP